MSTPAKPPVEILEPADYSQFLLHTKSEILFVLRGLKTAGDGVTMHFNDGRDFVLTTVLAADDGGVTLDVGSVEEMNRRALAADKLHCSTSHDKVRVQFVLHGLRTIEFEGRTAFRAPLPENLLRLQRREYYRLTTPLARPLKCQIPMPTAGGGQVIAEANVIDISGGGLAVMAPTSGVTFAPGQEFPNCRIELPEVGILVAVLQVRSVFDVTLRSGAQVTRAGCQFVKLPGPMLTLVQRYIIKVERERKARESGIG